MFREGKSFSVFPFRVYYVCGEKVLRDALPAFPVQFGVAVGTKNFKNAVDRNRIKRLTREAYRLQKESLYLSVGTKGLQLAAFFIFLGKELPLYKVVYEKMTLSLQKLVSEME